MGGVKINKLPEKIYVFTTLKEYTPASFDKFVEDMVAAKDKSGQFEHAEITIREMNIVKATLKSYLQQLYHERVEYTQREEKE